MNPQYNQQQAPYYNYQQHIPGPPQPSWQTSAPGPTPAPQSPGGWHDPRFQTIPPPPSHSPHYGQNYGPPPANQYATPPPPPPPPQDNYHRPITPQYDTAQWGVKYNQNQHQHQHQQYRPDSQQSFHSELKPALPPRPGSSLSYASQQQQQSSASNYQSHLPQYPPQGSWTIPAAPHPEQKPPTPPPRPTAYASTSQFDLTGPTQDHYSHHAPTHHYDPQQQTQSQQTWQQPQQYPTAPPSQASWNSFSNDGPVSPIEDDKQRQSLLSTPTGALVDAEPPSQNMQLPTRPSPSPLGVAPEVKANPTSFTSFSGLTDWQHYNPADPHGLTEEQSPGTSSQAPQFTASPIKTHTSLRRKSIERTRPARKPTANSPPVVTPQKLPAVQDQAPLPKVTGPTELPHNDSLQRHNSGQSNESSVGDLDRNDTIDNVIQAWYAPLTADSGVQTSQPPTPAVQRPNQTRFETFDRLSQTDFPPQIETRIETRIENKEIEVDRYADIQNEYKATLKRFAEMLRQEAAAGDDEEKFKIFQGFVIRELRLRSVLYGVEAQTHVASPRVQTDQEKGQQLPPAPAPAPVPAAPVQAQTIPTESMKAPTEPSQQPQLKLDTKEDSFVMVNPDGDDSEYSPGGRPRMQPLRLKTPKSSLDATKNGFTHSTTNPPTDQKATNQVSPSSNAPMTFDDYVMPDRPSPSSNAPIVVGTDESLGGPINAELTGPLNFSPSRPQYQPFRPGEVGNNPIPEVQVHAPPAESFAALRQSNAAEAGRTLVHDPPPSNIETAPNRGDSKTPGGRREHEEAFIGLIRAKSQAIRKTANNTPRPESPAILRAGTPMNRTTPSPVSVSPLVKSVQSLFTIIPKLVPSQPGPKSPPHPRMEPIVTAMQTLQDDFGFIHARVLTWDKSNRQIRAKQDSERQTRQSQNEERIDQLFNDNEIGYADIGELEKDFKLEEAGRKYTEDQDELDSFTRGVFDVVVEKLDGEIKELARLQINAIDMLDLESSTAAKQVQNSVSQGTGTSLPVTAPISAIMQILLDLNNKLEIRYLKIAEATFERERRRKRLEVSVLYTNNDIPGIKKLEAEFAKAERVQVLEEARKKAERANRLMDSFDRAVVRGLAENQGLVDDILTRLQLTRDLVLGSVENGPQGRAREDLLYGDEGVKDLMDRTMAAIDFIHSDSKALVHMLDKADALSNNADFELYMSEARLADASAEKYQKLKSEKEVEDRSVSEELTSRLSGIARAPEEISILVREVKDKIGTDVGHEERIGKALEAAKRRNTGSIG